MSNRQQFNPAFHDASDARCEYHKAAARLKGVAPVRGRVCPRCVLFQTGGWAR